jgi:hypothetical protein
MKWGLLRAWRDFKGGISRGEDVAVGRHKARSLNFDVVMKLSNGLIYFLILFVWPQWSGYVAELGIRAFPRVRHLLVVQGHILGVRVKVHCAIRPGDNDWSQ